MTGHCAFLTLIEVRSTLSRVQIVNGNKIFLYRGTRQLCSKYPGKVLLKIKHTECSGGFRVGKVILFGLRPRPGLPLASGPLFEGLPS